MSYTVLARRYRSQAFDQVVGQEAIARTLAQAIEQDRVAHAYLFVGTRGVGKTSMARIFAKALNGGSPEVDRAIMTGQDTDVIEIDAASNSKVDETRELIANAVYKPLRGKHKIYIIDEVHMLSTAAFNALLKTLEEPPEHVKFILCTTETHKVPATIQSRCQRFDFRSLSVAEIVGHLESVCKSEKVKAESDALHAVSRLANGSMRDALSLLDRLMAARSGKEAISVNLLESLLGLPARETMEQIVGALADSDAAGALELCDALLAQGITMEQLCESLVLRLRDLMLLVVCGAETALVDLSDEVRERALEQSARFDESGLVHMMALCESVQRMAKGSSTPRALFDALIVRLAIAEKLADVTRLLEGGPAPEPKPAPPRSAGAARGAPSKKS